MKSYLVEKDLNRNSNNSLVNSEESVLFSGYEFRDADLRNISDGNVDSNG